MRLFIILLLLSSCNLIEEIKPKHWKTYTIEQGNHYSNGTHIALIESTHIDFKAKFNSSAIYDLGNKSAQTSINKLYGFSDCNSQHHKNSARFGWLWNVSKQQLEIYAYVYLHGNVITHYLGNAIIDQEQDYSIYIGTDYYNFNFEGNQVQIPRGCNLNNPKYLLYPYFGGNNTAPHQVTIEIKRT